MFADRVRRLVAPGKEHPDFWFHTHDTAHRLGIPTHCTMLYGHVETYEERVDHLLRLREQQDKTGGFLAFIPLAFHPENTVFERRGWKHTTGSDDLKMIAVSRLLLDNIANIKAYWIMMGLPLAQVALHFGANDVQGTVVREQIFHAAGARTETEQKIPELVRFVREAGRIPVQRDTLYDEVRRWDAAGVAAGPRETAPVHGCAIAPVRRAAGGIVAQDVSIVGNAGAYPLLSTRVLFAGAAPLHRAVPMRRRPRREPCGLHQHGAEQRVSRLRRNAGRARA